MKKLWQYREAGVKEYWIVEPANQYIEVYWLDGSGYRVEAYSEGQVRVGIFKDLTIDLNLVFPKNVPENPET